MLTFSLSLLSEVHYSPPSSEENTRKTFSTPQPGEDGVSPLRLEGGQCWLKLCFDLPLCHSKDWSSEGISLPILKPSLLIVGEKNFPYSGCTLPRSLIYTLFSLLPK